MKSGVAWNVKGVDDDARETARAAARRAGLSVGEWLNSVIIETAGDAVADQRQERARRERADFSAIHRHLDELAARLSKMIGGRSVAGESAARRADAGEDTLGEIRTRQRALDTAREG